MMRMIKSDLRKKYRNIRKNVRNKEFFDEKISENFFNTFNSINFNSIGGYIPIDGEVNGLLIMDHLFKQRKIVTIPRICTDLLQFTIWNPDISLTLNPKYKFYYIENKDNFIPELILVPVVAFNTECMRLGFGGGFYDRTISNLRAQYNSKINFVGLAYHEQLCSDLIYESHDQVLDYIITQDKVYFSK
jgi:5,10-methenyltetrahydrofolate synthetase